MLCFAYIFCGPYDMHHTVGHYQLAVKCVVVCTCVSKGVAKFLYHISDVLGLS